MTKTNGAAAAYDLARAETLAEPVTAQTLPPTPEERQKAFIDAYNALVTTHGVQLLPQMQPRVHGDIIQVEAQLVVALVPDWKPQA